MSFDWSEYFDLAQELIGLSEVSSGQEARSRTAISRAYYAAFCMSRNHLRDNDNKPVPKGARAHKYVKAEFKSSTDQVRQNIGRNLDRLRIERNKADYDDVVQALTNNTTFAIGLANRTLSDLASL